MEPDLEARVLLACVPRIKATIDRTGRRFRTQAEERGLLPGPWKGIELERETVVVS